MLPRIFRRSLGTRLAATFVAVGVASVTSLGWFVYTRASTALVQRTGTLLEGEAASIMDRIDRNLFERYGDVQAFAGNPMARGTPEQVSGAANLYTQLYGIYDLMLVVSPDGTVLASNTVDKDGHPVPARFSGRSVKGEPWFEAIIGGHVARGESWYGPAQRDAWVNELANTNDLSLNFAAPVYDDNGRIVRVWSNRASWHRVVGEIVSYSRSALRERGATTLDINITTHDGIVLEDADPSVALKLDLAKAGVAAAASIAAGKRGWVEGADPRQPEPQLFGYAASVGALGFKGYGWGAILRQSRGEALAEVHALAVAIVASTLALAALIAVVALLVARGVTKPLGRVVEAFSSLGGGDLTVRVGSRAEDEIGRLGRSFDSFVTGLEQTVTSIQGAVTELAGDAESLDKTAEQLEQSAQTEAAALQSTTAAVEELGATIGHNAENAVKANESATSSRLAAEKGNEVVGSVVVAMGEINEASARIHEIISSIDEIAFQTNLLALNAAIEAERAGDSGRGFAVVANEVRKLAERSATAAREIKTLVKDSSKRIDHGSKLVSQSGEELSAIREAATSVADMVDQISTASREQEIAVREVSSAMHQIDGEIQKSAVRVSDLTVMSRTMSGRAANVADLVGRFRVTAGAAQKSTVASQPRVERASSSPEVIDLIVAGEF
jgi:methyl-accepting chemotaxis protein